MIKYFCDVCGNNILSGETKYVAITIGGMSEYIFEECCSDCIDSIKKAVSSVCKKM